MRVQHQKCALAICVVAALGCKKTDSEGTKNSAPAAAAPAAALDATRLAERIGIKPGAVKPAKNAGAAAVLSASSGEVSVRRMGTDTFAPATDKGALRAGDVVRTGVKGRVTLVLADRSVVELAEETALAIGDRQAGADPASSIAVLYGVARVTVSERAPGEGAFLAYVPPGMVAAKGTVFSVGAAASGQARVGVETGVVEAAGGAALATPATVSAGQVVTIEMNGRVSGPQTLARDDWAEWRLGAEGSLDARAAAELQAKRLQALTAEIDATFEWLSGLTRASVQVVAEADAHAKSNASAEYAASAEMRAATLEATFLVSLELQRLVYAAGGHAFVIGELYARHPVAVAPVYVATAPELSGALLYEKKFHAVAEIHLTPLRTAYYVHVPAGRVNAAAVGQVIPAFFAKVELPAVPAVAVAGRAQVPVYAPPRITGHAVGKVVLAVPPPGWKVAAEVRPAPYAHGAWHVPSANAQGKLIAGLVARAEIKPVFPPMPEAPSFESAAPRFDAPRMSAGATLAVHGQIKAVAVHGAHLGGGVGAAGRIDAPSVKVPSAKVTAAASARERAEGAGIEAKGRVAVGVGGAMKAAASVKTAVPPPPPPPSVGAGAGANLQMKAGFKIGAGVKTGGAAEAAPPPPPPPAEGEGGAKAEAKGSFKIGSKMKLKTE